MNEENMSEAVGQKEFYCEELQICRECTLDFCDVKRCTRPCVATQAREAMLWNKRYEKCKKLESKRAQKQPEE